MHRRKRSRIPAFRTLVRRIGKHADAIVAAVELDLSSWTCRAGSVELGLSSWACRAGPVELGLSNSRLEGIGGKIRLVRRRGHGYRNLDALTAAIHLCFGGVTRNLPTET